MKKVIVISLFFAFLSISLLAQAVKPWPIPSFMVPIDSSFARFQEDIHRYSTDASREKRDIHVKIIGHSSKTQICQAQVWIYSLDGLDILGPYTVFCGGTLVVEIDGREWGVLVQTNSSVLVDVWIE